MGGFQRAGSGVKGQFHNSSVAGYSVNRGSLADE